MQAVYFFMGESSDKGYVYRPERLRMLLGAHSLIINITSCIVLTSSIYVLCAHAVATQSECLFSQNPNTHIVC